jgi:hypothetical protein
MERIAMDQEERDWLDLWTVDAEILGREDGISDRWVRELLTEMKTKGDAVVLHGLRGRSSNRQIDKEIRTKVIEILKSPDWHDLTRYYTC